MHSGKVGRFRPVARTGVIASSIALLAMLFSPNGALAATVIGAAAGDITCGGQFNLVQVSSVAPSSSVESPGSITTWSTFGGGYQGPVGLLVWRPTTTALSYELIGASPLETLTSPNVNTFTLVTRIPVQTGDRLGLRFDAPAATPAAGICGLYVAGGGTYGFALGANPTKNLIYPFTPDYNLQLNVSATVDTTIITPPPSSGCDSTGSLTGGDNCKQ